MERDTEQPAHDRYEGLEVRFRRRPNPASDGLTTFRYNRAERESAAPCSGDRATGGFFRRNRSLTLTLIDVSIVLVLFGIYWFFLRPADWQTRIDGFRFRAEATLIEQQVDLRVRVDGPRGRDDRAVWETRVVSVHSAGASQSDLAPEADRHRYLQLSVDLSALETDLTPAQQAGDERRTTNIDVEVGLDDQRVVLRVPVRSDAWPQTLQDIFR